VGDVLSEMYLTSATLKHFIDQGSQESDLPPMRWACDDSLYRIQEALRSLFRNLPFPPLAWNRTHGLSRQARQLLGPIKAMKLMLTGRSLSGRSAMKIGLLDLCVPERQLQDAARQVVHLPPQDNLLPWYARLPGNPLLRPLFASFLKRETAKKIDSSQYPSPFALIDHWK